MIYFDCAATSLQKPKAVNYAVNRAMTVMASPGRGCHKPAMLAADTVLNCRVLLASYFNVADPENVIFTFNATHGLNIAINSIVSERDKVVISGYEHNSVTRPLKELKADVIIAASPLFDQPSAVEAFRKALPNAKCAVCTHVSNAFGYILPIWEISALCREYGVPLIIDASQSAGTIPIDFSALGAAFIAMPGHKGLLGPQGTGVLLCNHETKPIMYGGTGSNSTISTMPEYLPDRLEAGTHNVAGIAGLEQGVKYVMSKPKGALLSHEKRLCADFAKKISLIPGIKLFFDNSLSCQSGVLSMYSQHMDSDMVAEKLGKEGICVRAGLHCSPISHETVGTIEKGTVRFSFSPFNTMQEVVYTAEILKKIFNSM
ncbi:MAG: aminotransferase class V-fold PLP-dependent enzyme [Clostridiales bacterium]|jgi:cysteine desulfurase family protein|nr:aminotransferase class V-fold PLP-dependent enzyme [Clostridiales bacterium]